jgi:CelD/BcsL family acetyltransferase involved in cellulose biosynthesis
MIHSTQSGEPLTTRVLRTVLEVEQIACAWRDLFHHCRATAFQSPDWLLPWIEVFSPHKIIMVEVRLAGRLIGLAPLLVYPRAAERCLAFMGGGVSDYLDLLVDPAFESEVIQEILNVISPLEDWTVLDLTDLPHHSSLLRTLWFEEHSREHVQCSVLRLPQSTKDLPDIFSPHQRANLRNARSRLQRAGGGVIEIAAAGNVSEFLDDLFTLHTSRWSGQGQPGVLADRQVREFHKCSAPRLLENGLLYLSRLRVGDRTAAVIYSLRLADTTYCYLQGFDPQFSSLSPGTQLMFSVISDTVRQGMRKFDFLRGQESYKQHWRAEPEPTFRIQLPRAALMRAHARHPAPVVGFFGL